MKAKSAVFSLLGMIVILMSMSPALAALGERADSIDSDQKNLSARKTNADVFRKYSVQELTSDAQTLKEYVNNDGIVFAITWQGVSHPDLAAVLGSYYSGYHASVLEQPRHHGIRSFAVKRENLVVQKWGSMRNLKGRAFDPSLIPAGVAINEIQ